MSPASMRQIASRHMTNAKPMSTAACTRSALTNIPSDTSRTSATQ